MDVVVDDAPLVAEVEYAPHVVSVLVVVDREELIFVWYLFVALMTTHLLH